MSHRITVYTGWEVFEAGIQKTENFIVQMYNHKLLLQKVRIFRSYLSAQRFFGCWLTFESSIVDMQYNIGVIW